MSDIAHQRSDAEVTAAGGVVTRSHAGVVQMVVVHRPMGDWSLPKGKVERSEEVDSAALREVREETGLVCRLGEFLGETWYRDGRGRLKLVLWWAMTPLDSSSALRPDNPDEIDDLRWVDVAEALRLLTYESDRDLVVTQI